MPTRQGKPPGSPAQRGVRVLRCQAGRSFPLHQAGVGALSPDCLARPLSAAFGLGSHPPEVMVQALLPGHPPAASTSMSATETPCAGTSQPHLGPWSPGATLMVPQLKDELLSGQRSLEEKVTVHLLSSSMRHTDPGTLYTFQGAAGVPNM